MKMYGMFKRKELKCELVSKNFDKIPTLVLAAYLDFIKKFVPPEENTGYDSWVTLSASWDINVWCTQWLEAPEWHFSLYHYPGGDLLDNPVFEAGVALTPV